MDYVIHFEVCLIVSLFTKFASRPGLGWVWLVAPGPLRAVFSLEVYSAMP